MWTVEALPMARRRIFDEIRRRGRVPRGDFPASGGVTDSLRRLCESGLVRVVQETTRDGKRRRRTAIFVPVGAGEVEQAAAAYRSGKRKPTRKRAREFDLEERARKGGLLSEWYRHRRAMIELTDLLRGKILPMVFQENVPPGEIARFEDDVEEFGELIAQAKVDLAARRKEDATRATIDRLERMAAPDSGASENEQRQARGHADRLRGKLPDS